MTINEIGSHSSWIIPIKDEDKEFKITVDYDYKIILSIKGKTYSHKYFLSQDEATKFAKALMQASVAAAWKLPI